jgi:hypothetical protein
MSVGVMEDYKLRDLRASHTLGLGPNIIEYKKLGVSPRAVFTQLKNRAGLVLAKESALRITLNLDGAPIISKSHTHPSHSQTSRLLTSSLSLVRHVTGLWARPVIRLPSGHRVVPDHHFTG